VGWPGNGSAMTRILSFLFVVACSGPTQQQVLETPTATTQRVPVEAPAASTSDEDREQLIQEFDDMNDTQQAYREAQQQQADREAAKRRQR
jgi:hypothetical protein